MSRSGQHDSKECLTIRVQVQHMWLSHQRQLIRLMVWCCYRPTNNIGWTVVHVAICHESIHTILHVCLRYWNLWVHWVPQNLTMSRCVGQEHLKKLQKEVDSFLLLGMNPSGHIMILNFVESMQWKHTSPPPNKSRSQPSAKIMLTFFFITMDTLPSSSCDVIIITFHSPESIGHG